MEPIPAARTKELRAFLEQLLRAMASIQGTDLHLVPGAPPFVRVAGTLTRTQAPPLDAATVRDLLRLTADREVAPGMGSFEFSFEEPGLARFRGHAFREAGGWALALRLVQLAIPTFKDLRLPPVIQSLAEPQPGLLLVTGPTGSGKSTSVAAILRHMATTHTLRIITVEDPVEHRLVDVSSCVSQREVGRDTGSFSEALKAALREDPDVIFVGEIRDLESLDVAVQAAESGLCVLSTFHTASALKTLQRLVALYRPEDQAAARLRLADVLRGVVSQRLLPRRDRRGRVICTEVLINNYAVKECLRDATRLSGVTAILERSADQQMHTFDSNLTALVRDGLVALEAALPFAASPADLKRALSISGLVA